MKFTGERCIIGESGDLLEKEHLARYEFVLQYLRDKKVLDMGCGSGYGSDLMASVASEVIGVDINEEAITYAGHHYKRENIKFHLGNVTNLNFLKAKEFDVIVSFEVVEHLENRLEYLKEARRILKDEGILLISTPNKKYSSPDSEKPLNTFHVIEYKLDDFKKLLKEHFGNVIIYGQYYHSRIRNFVKKLLPKKAWTALQIRVGGSYHVRHASGFSDKDVENHSYFVAVCRK